MAQKQFSVVTRTYEALPRSKRLRGRGVNGSESGGGSSAVTVIGDGDGHTHANKTTLDAQSMDAEGYLYLKYKPDGSDDSKEEKVKAGYADEAAHAKEADNADKWDGKQFADYLDQSVKKNDNVQFKSLITEQVGTPDFLEGLGGSGFGITRDANGDAVITTDILQVRKKAEFYELAINQTSFELGETVKSLAGCEITSVEEVEDVYRCYYDNKGGKRYSGFNAGDQARCQRYDADFGGIIKYYWRVVKSVGENYVDLYMSGQDENGVTLVDGDDIPSEGDNIVQFGHRTDATRQTAIIIASTPTPTILQYVGINSFVLPEPVTKISPDDNVFTGKVHIGAGSTGVENLEGIPEAIQEAMSGVEISRYNLLRNSGFEGDYTTAELNGKTPLNSDSAMFSPRLKYWTTYGDVKVVSNNESTSGYAVEMINDAWLIQTLDAPVIKGEHYILSFKGKGTKVLCGVGDDFTTIELGDAYAVHSYSFQASSESKGFMLQCKQDDNATICELQLERGDIRTAWGRSFLDNSKEQAAVEAIKYLSNAIKEGSTDIIGGLILSNMIMLGNYVNGTMEKVTAGISGTYVDDKSVALWGGGSYEEAIRTVARLMSGNNEWADNMANFVVTHGGDIFLKGYINALGGIFRGAVEIAEGKILLNADGSGKLAKGNISWDSFGRLYRKAPDTDVWTNISKYSGKTVDYTLGSNLDLVLDFSYTDDNGGEFWLDSAPADGYTIQIKGSPVTYQNKEKSAVLLGTFYASGLSKGYARLVVDNVPNGVILESYGANNVWLVKSAVCIEDEDEITIRVNEFIGGGANTTFTTSDGKTATVKNGLIVNIE